MNKKKGFTLIELLAVIVLLAILVIIAVPNVIKMLNNTKQKTFMVEAENVIKGAKNAYASNTLNGIDKTCYSLSELSDYIDKDFTGYSGSVQIDASHNIWLTNDKYIVAGSYSGNIEVVTLTSPVTATDECEEMYVVANGEGEQVTTTISALTTQIEALQQAVANIYPIGSVYTSTTLSTPSAVHDALGGIWVVYGAGKVLVGLDASDTDFDSTTDTGGEKTHVLTVNEMPTHAHFASTGINNNGNMTFFPYSAIGSATTGDTETKGWGATTTDTGNNFPHNNMPPYVVVYMYQRTA